MAGVAIIELARFEIENCSDDSNEQHVSIVARYFDVGGSHQRSEIRFRCAQRDAFVERFADRHENARRKSFPRDIADQEEQATIVETKEIVQIAADFTRGRHRGRELDTIVVAKQIGARQHADLNPLRSFKLAGHSRRLVARCLHGLLQQRLLVRRLAFEQRFLARRFSKSHRQKRDRQRQKRDSGRHRVDEPVLRSKQDITNDQGQSDARCSDQSGRARGPMRSGKNQQRAEEQHDGEFGEACPYRSNEQRSVDQVFEKLRLHFGSRHRLAKRRVLIVNKTEPRDADQHHFATKPFVIDFAVERIDG